MKLLINLSVLLFLFSCNYNKQQEADPYATLPGTYANLLKANGGLEKWKSFKSLEYDLKHERDSVASEHYVLDLQNRKDLTVADSFQIGYDGEHVWVAPNRKSYKGRSARFYHNLYSYFFTIPFIVSDPGIKYGVDTLTVDGKLFDVINISFDKGVGDADQDSYKILVDPISHKMEMLLYTVTFYSGEAHENYNLLKYEAWNQISGIMLPTKLVGFKYSNGKIGDRRYEVTFSNIRLTTQSPDQELFAMPAMAEIDSLKK